jgi:polysaccharide pyruvyl transferase WcaK-like protein
MQRRAFLQALAALGAGTWAQRQRPPRLLLRSAWQTVNIGDIAHTPGLLALLEKHLPAAEVRLWPSKVDQGVEEMLRRRFPRLAIVQDEAAVQTALAECDFLLHGSGPSLVAQKDVERWVRETGKPYGVFGITFATQDSTATRLAPESALARTLAVLSAAQFVFFRDSASLELARKLGCTCPVQAFGPDAAFATDVRDEAKAEAFLAAHGLEPGRFLCCIPRLRYTPYWRMKPGVPFDPVKHARNEAMRGPDLAPLREATLAVVRQTPLKVLVCPEDSSQMAVGKENIIDLLPDDARARVVWRQDYWLTDEALSTYARSAGLFGAEMHSPILCLGQGVPALVCRWKEQTSKGLMWRDLGLGDWLFDLDQEEERARVVPAVLALAQDPAAARAKAAQAKARVESLQRTMIDTLRAVL